MSEAAFQVQGWCPSAWQPMRAADGWLVRVRPRCATLAMAQWRVLARLALEHAHPQVELTRLGNVQLRGVADAALAPLRRDLIEHGLVPAEADADLAPPVRCTPFHHAGDATHTLAQALADAVDRHLRPGALQAIGLVPLPSKFGLLVDDPQRCLSQTLADVRAWAMPEGGFALGLGRTLWRFASVDATVDAALHAARWFAAARMRPARPPTRLHALLEDFLPPAHWGQGVADAASADPVPPGPQGAFGHLLGVPLGRADARALLALADLLPGDAQMRVTPWRSLLIHPADAAGAAVAALRSSSSSAWALDAGDARLRVSACTGAPRCTQALGATQPLALRLAAHVPPGVHVHVSGCDKHCALPPEADALVSATASGAWAVAPARAGSQFQTSDLAHLLNT